MKRGLFTPASASAASKLATRENRSAGRLKIPAERRREISRAGALAKHAKRSPEERQREASRMGLLATAKRDPVERARSGRVGALVANAKRWGWVPPILRPLLGVRVKR